MANNWDKGIQQDFDNMTAELGTSVSILKKDVVNTRIRTEGSQSHFNTAVTETAVVQELNSEHEMVQIGQLNVGDVRFTFQSDSVIAEEDEVTKNSLTYKVIKLTKVRGFNNDVVTHITAFGKKISGR